MSTIAGLRSFNRTLDVTKNAVHPEWRRENKCYRKSLNPIAGLNVNFRRDEGEKLPTRIESPLSSGFHCSSKKKSDFSLKGSLSDEAYDENDPEEQQRRSLVAKRLESTARYFRRLGSIGFWGQLVCTVVSAVILVFSIVVTGTATTPVTTYLSCGGIAAGFLSTFWSYGYMRLANRLRSAVDNPSKAPPRANVVENLKNGLIINLLGMGATLLGLQATVGALVAKALTSNYSPFLQGAPAGYSPVLALDVFLVQACANALLSHFIGSVLTLELLRATTIQQPPPDNVIPNPV